MGDKTDIEGCVSHGPWGGSAGKSWIYKPNGFIKKITILHGNFVAGIKFDSSENESSQIGVKCSEKTDEVPDDIILIDYPYEYLMSISGTFNITLGVFTLGSLCFRTNHKRYGPYGGNLDGTPFSFEGKDVMIVGFHGLVSLFPTAIGIYVMPESNARGLNNSTSLDNSIHELCSRMSIPRGAGPWGTSKGAKPWDDGVFSTIKVVRVHVGGSPNVIHAIQFEYVDSNAKTVLSPMHGGTSGDKMELVNLDGTGEFLIGISGFYGVVQGYKGTEVITSITFHTNKGIYGPYGEKSGAGYQYFTTTASPGKIVGFHGWNDCFLTAIGVHMKYF
ncbi:hypothetical protein OSB04_006048 [Centaurea solstitialis]|uniref:Jacalin-type lectin domain-containing protein n=1 Tax=Centaurea solstitialis TaxID=347529 RepID=A0AA38U1T6_9ASTR|nr:hypothetical protein OSB04_006048 [Centaurea solstitialis]